MLRRLKNAFVLTLTVAAFVVAAACATDESSEESPPTHTTIPFADFVGMYSSLHLDNIALLPPDRRPGQHDIPDDIVHGKIEIDGPCLYIQQLETWGDGGFYRDSSGAIQTYLLALPYNTTRYDPQTQSLWAGQYGPIANRDTVTAFGDLESDLPKEFFADQFETCPLANGGRLSGTLVPGLAEVKCRGDGKGVAGMLVGAEDGLACV
ncbi:hypothetical protein [Candidatus Poriferisodalis sp.]|uniref:hypothetical protein n=1 Tax=Candidatus Poriferisodalis sp. TaxID=3101277 RepID=UPI003B01497E